MISPSALLRPSGYFVICAITLCPLTAPFVMLFGIKISFGIRLSSAITIRMHGYLQMFQQLEAWRVPIYELPSLQAGSHYHLFSQDALALYHYSLQRLNQNDEYIRLSVPRHPELKKQILSYAFE